MFALTQALETDSCDRQSDRIWVARKSSCDDRAWAAQRSPVRVAFENCPLPPHASAQPLMSVPHGFPSSLICSLLCPQGICDQHPYEKTYYRAADYSRKGMLPPGGSQFDPCFHALSNGTSRAPRRYYVAWQAFSMQATIALRLRACLSNTLRHIHILGHPMLSA